MKENVIIDDFFTIFSYNFYLKFFLVKNYILYKKLYIFSYLLVKIKINNLMYNISF